MTPNVPAPARFRAGRRRTVALAVLAASSLALAAGPASALRLANYNLLNWSGASGVARVPYMRAIARGIGPDLVATQEMIDQAGVNLFRDQVLNFREPGEWEAAPFTNGPDTDNALFYRASRLELVETVEIPTTLRNVSRYHLRLRGYPVTPGTDFYVYSFHLKSSQGTAEEAQRLSEMQVIRANAENLPPGSHVLFCGDYNVYTSGEAAFQHALASIGQNIGRMKDPIDQLGAWHDAVAFRFVHTQSPRTVSFGGGATGGVDDRFDFILESYNWDDGQGLELLEATYTAYGNDGNHFNLQLDSGPNTAVGELMADSLTQASDHLPVFADLSVPARLGLPVVAHDFGTVIEGAAASFELPVSNPAMAPGDALDYAFAPAASFGVPVGPLVLAPGAATTHTITMLTSTPGAKAESIGLSTDAPGDESRPLELSGLVLRHAQPSSDSALVVVADTLDFGTQESGGFADRVARIRNAGYDALQAALRVAGAAITGGAGRFQLAEPFAAQIVTDGWAAYDVAFEDDGATTESTYTATLTFETSDDPALPGAVARPAVGFTLLARVSNPLVDAGDPDGIVPPARTLLFAPHPNPVTGARTQLRFDLARPGRVRLAIFDARGRHVATVLDGGRAAGRHAVPWDGLEAGGGAAANGVYFAQLVSEDGGSSSRRFVLLR
jgi:endonuclease/exonuclease/phosphatase family metal-dependent hydrolase